MGKYDPVEVRATLGGRDGTLVQISITERDITIESGRYPMVYIFLDDAQVLHVGVQSMKTGEMMFTTQKEA